MYVLRSCRYDFHQHTDYRGRPSSKVYPSHIDAVLDVPTDDFLEYWAIKVSLSKAGYLVFYQEQGGAAWETIFWQEGYCVGYREEFDDQRETGGEPSFLLYLSISAPDLEWKPGGPPGPFIPPAPREHGTPPAVAAASVVAAETAAETAAAELVAEPTLAELLSSAGSALAEGVEALAALAAVPVLLTLGLILGSATPAGGPGIPQFPPLPADPKLLRLKELAAKYVAGTLTAAEEAEMIDLLAKVKGVHVQKLADLKTVSADFVGKVPMEESDLGRMALKHRIENDAWHDGNIAVFEYEDNQGKLQHLVQSTLPSTKKHAERLALEKLAADKIPSRNIKRIYSELEPCEVDSGGIHGEGCKMMLNTYFPSAKVTYSYDYAGRLTDTKPSRTASLKKRAADFAKYKNLKP